MKMDVNWPAKQILAWTWLLSWLISNRSKHCLNIYFKAIANLDKNVASYGQLERLLIFCLNFADNKARNKQGMAFLFFFMNYSLRTADAFPAVAVVDWCNIYCRLFILAEYLKTQMFLFFEVAITKCRRTHCSHPYSPIFLTASS